VICIVAYIVVFVVTFFVGSFLLARYGSESGESPMEPLDFNFLMLAVFSLMWPITVPLATATMILIYVAKLATRLSGGKK